MDLDPPVGGHRVDDDIDDLRQAHFHRTVTRLHRPVVFDPAAGLDADAHRAVAGLRPQVGERAADHDAAIAGLDVDLAGNLAEADRAVVGARRHFARQARADDRPVVGAQRSSASDLLDGDRAVAAPQVERGRPGHGDTQPSAGREVHADDHAAGPRRRRAAHPHGHRIAVLRFLDGDVLEAGLVLGLLIDHDLDLGTVPGVDFDRAVEGVEGDLGGAGHLEGVGLGRGGAVGVDVDRAPHQRDGECARAQRPTRRRVPDAITPLRLERRPRGRWGSTPAPRRPTSG